MVVGIAHPTADHKTDSAAPYLSGFADKILDRLV